MWVALISLDLGSSGARASVFREDGRLIGDARHAYTTHYPVQGWAQQDAQRWYDASIDVLTRVRHQLPKSCQVEGLALTGQCPTFVPVDAQFTPLGPALTYQDNRAVAEAADLERRFGVAGVRARSGNSPQAFFILPKVMWLAAHQPALYDQLAKVLQPSDYLAWRLTGELATSTAHACGTLAFDIGRRLWNADWLSQLDLRADLFPDRVLDPWSIVGQLTDDVAAVTGLPRRLPVVIGAPDSQSNCLGVGAIEPGMLSNMSGSSTCLNMSVDLPVADQGVANYADVLPDKWNAEVGLNTTGAALSWATRVLLPDVTSSERYETVERLASRSRPGANGVTFMPYLTGGERDSQAVKGGFHNLSMANGVSDMLRAVLEGVAFAERERIEVLVDSGCEVSQVIISGGGAKFDMWNQMKADVTGWPVQAIAGVDAAELGAAMLAGIGVGVFGDAADAVEACRPAVSTFMPNKARSLEYERRYREFVELERNLAASCSVTTSAGD